MTHKILFEFEQRSETDRQTDRRTDREKDRDELSVDRIRLKKLSA
jgi:hypothetical protein